MAGTQSMARAAVWCDAPAAPAAAARWPGRCCARLADLQRMARAREHGRQSCEHARRAPRGPTLAAIASPPAALRHARPPSR
jgi:hypothetical protein